MLEMSVCALANMLAYAQGLGVYLGQRLGQKLKANFAQSSFTACCRAAVTKLCSTFAMPFRTQVKRTAGLGWAIIC